MEKNIMWEGENYWVYRDNKQYTLYRHGAVCSYADSSYEMTQDGLSIAIMRAKYLDKSKA